MTLTGGLVDRRVMRTFKTEKEMNKKQLASKLDEFRRKANMNEAEAQRARYRSDENYAQYCAGVCDGLRLAALELENAMLGREREYA